MNVTKEDFRALELDTIAIKNNDGEQFITKENAKSFDLSFSDLNYSVRPSFFSIERKKILANVSGSFRTGELTAIMGPSGAGKTTLMDILAGFVPTSVKGAITINGKVRNLNAFRRLSAYIMQHNVLHDLLTVQESMHVAAELKLSASTAHKKERINIILKDLGLDVHRATLAGSLSGGQKKRLVIAMELISDLPIMFLDEPTSGLDSVTSKQCIELMKFLARTGRMVICTIHQPSASLFNIMDNIYVVAKGRCIYSGSPENVIPFLSAMGIRCPEYHNPADFLLEVACGDYGDYIVKLSEAIKNGSNRTYQRITSDYPSIDLDSTEEEQLAGRVVTKQSKQKRRFCDCESRKANNYASSFWTQIRVLLWRYILKTFRDRGHIRQIFIAHLLMAVITGSIYYNIGQKASRALDNVKQLDFNMLFISFCALNSALITFPMELQIMKREYFNHWYKLLSVYIANTYINFIIVVIAVSIYTLITYYLCDQLPELRRLGYLMLVNITIALINQAIGFLISVNLSVKNVVFIGSCSVMPFVLCSGIFIRQRDVHLYLRWVYDISIYKHALEGVMSSMFGFNRERLKCTEDYCHFSSPNQLLNFIGVERTNYWSAELLLIGIFFTIHVLTYISLIIKLKITIFR